MSPERDFKKLYETLLQAREHFPDNDPFKGNAIRLFTAARELYRLNQQRTGLAPAVVEGQFIAAGAQPADRQQLEDLQTYLELADAAYNDNGQLWGLLEGLGYALVRYAPETGPGKVGHFLAFSPSKKELLVALKGTDTLADVLTDVVSAATPLETSEAAAQTLCHEGMRLAALQMAADLCRLVEHLFLPLGYAVTITGHSLGAGTAAILGLILRSRFETLRDDARLRVIAFATPPVLDAPTARACGPFTISVVNCLDVIPRASLGNLVAIHQLLVAIDAKLQGGEDLSAERLGDLWHTAKARVQAHATFLHVPGTVVFFFRHANDHHAAYTCTSDQLPALQRIELQEGMIGHHQIAAYREALVTEVGHPWKLCERSLSPGQAIA